jgi:hypothetical protein
MYVVYEERDNDMHVSFLCGKSEPDLQQVEVGKGSWYRLQTQADVDSMLDETEREVKEYEALTDLEKTRLAKEGEEERKDQTNRGIGRATSKDDFDRMIVQLKLAGRVKEENGKLTWLK